jgi:hypothetical protein
MKNPNITITVLHNIFLTREERYKLAEGGDVEVVGVSVPVWFHRGKTTEPANEVFCKYRICNAPVSTPITNYEDGYVMNLPQEGEVAVAIKPTGEEIPSAAPNPKMLRDIKDGGSGYMQFKQYTKVRKGRSIFNLLHFVEIKELEVLLDTLAYG